MCISLDEIVRLSELQTGDELILSIIDKEGVDRTVSAQDVIHLKEKGVSEGVIDYLWKQSYQAEKEFLPPQEGESRIIGENLRTYTSIDESGNKKLVLTNLDEQGRRMGPPPPPAPERAQEPEIVYVTQPAPQTYDNVKSNIPAWAEMPYYQPPTYSPIINDYGYGYGNGYGYYPFYSVATVYPGPVFPQHCKTPLGHNSWGRQSMWGHQMKWGGGGKSIWSGSRKR